ncbi:MAG: tetratricopeptide repeat protein [Candidatus Eremiobacteraeota bacterium]|nr:tetratricopeptide repeat protein [Candidatus Eremiobacteraeota bacterium]MBV8332049.1 tetratricopeptide repeat protein [Candidatus Eremiobacteraeota bacterium]MBV8433610.1 tetratricopeptide repeat protein [Candidatus Eremiobacteraeota bacterium]MBV8583073.1 tetratricopeptide repeat protein [Candidatus Eremiobacteraeota bacterium]MBV8722615.1 tetratricopeptide repeat protein [Candidatus Eremiobacteraeota bacterium]
METGPARGLPPRIYLPLVAVTSLIFLGVMAYLVAAGFGVSGSVFGKGGAPDAARSQRSQGSQANVEGGPPPAVAEQVKSLRDRIAAHPGDDVALTQLGDMYLAAGKYGEAIPLYRRALNVNPRNVAAQTGLAQAQDAMRP